MRSVRKETEKTERTGCLVEAISGINRARVRKASPRMARIQGLPGKKKGTEKSQSPDGWWSWRELNPRPQAFFEQFYMRSVLFWFLATGIAQTHATPAASTLLSRPHLRYPGGDQPM